MGSYRTIDLHMHTTISDGTDPPEKLLAIVKEKGISLFSITDHDAIRSSWIIPGLLGRENPDFISGVEFSCKDEQGKYHVLGYGYDPEADSIRRVVETGHSYRMNKVKARLSFLDREFGFRFPEKEIQDLLKLANPGKPHIGNLMVKYGYAGTKEEAIKNYINRLHFKGGYVRPEEAIQGILGAGGIPVLAHPSFGSGDQLILGEEMDRRLRRLMQFGLKGVEAFYSGFSPKLQEEILAFAGRYDLYVTAGSDYHGRNKLVVPGDTGMKTYTPVPEGMERFLADCRILSGREGV
ncbi:MAG: PHP domain-containing protein [Eubacteriales bacterium]|nr:PHP domain-containing protein [Eubacteriales bacterium]